MKALVTGAGGQVAQALARSRPESIELVLLSRAQLDIADPEQVAAALDTHVPDVVVNCAAYTAVDRAEAEEAAALRANAKGPGVLAQSLRARPGARLVHISTDFVFDGQATTPYLPEAQPAPLSAYGRTKEQGEQAVRKALPDRSVIVRTSWVYGREGRNFVHTMLRLMRERGGVQVVADQVGSPTSADSLAAALWRCALDPALSGVIHWTDGGGGVSWFEFAQAIRDEGVLRGLLPAGVQVGSLSTAEYPTPARRPAYSVLDLVSSGRRLGLSVSPWRVELAKVMESIARG